MSYPPAPAWPPAGPRVPPPAAPGYPPRPGYAPTTFGGGYGGQPAFRSGPPVYPAMGFPAPPPPRRSSGLKVLLGVCGCVIALMLTTFVGCGVLAAMLPPVESTTYGPTPEASTPTPVRTPTLRTPTPVQTPTPARTPTPKPPTPFNPPNVDTGGGSPYTDPVVLANPINQVVNPALPCGSREKKEDQAAYEAYARGMADCLATAWAPLLPTVGLTYERPALVFYYAPLTTPCGTSPAAGTAFYCPASNSMYLGTHNMEVRNRWLSLDMTIMHEHGHALQYMAGYDGAYRQMLQIEARAQVQRRFELQTTCWSIQATRATRLNFTDKDMETALDHYVGDTNHGTTANINVWLAKGWHGKNYSACNTWAAGLTYLQ